MKRYILIFLLGVYFNSASAQNYFALPDSNATWIMQCDDGFSGWVFPEYTLPFHKRDTVINSITYTKFPGIGAFRNNGAGITYLVPEDSLNEYILEDLSKNLGDTVYNVIYGSPPFLQIYNFVVDSVNNIPVGPYSLKRMCLHSPQLNCNQFRLIWIEKIGCANGGFLNQIECGFGSCFLNCMSSNDTSFWQAQSMQIPQTIHYYLSQICSSPAGLKMLYPSLEQMNVLPNPTKDYSIIRLYNRSDKILSIEIFNMQGKIIEKLPGEKNYELEISSDNLQQGLYFLRVKTLFGLILNKKLIVIKS